MLTLTKARIVLLLMFLLVMTNEFLTLSAQGQESPAKSLARQQVEPWLKQFEKTLNDTKRNSELDRILSAEIDKKERFVCELHLVSSGRTARVVCGSHVSPVLEQFFGKLDCPPNPPYEVFPPGLIVVTFRKVDESISAAARWEYRRLNGRVGDPTNRDF